MSKQSDTFGSGVLTGVVGLVILFLGLTTFLGDPRSNTHAELCPTILALSPTAADSLAVFKEHVGCFEFIQSESKS